MEVGAGSCQLRFIELLLGGFLLRAQGLKVPLIDSFDAVQTGRPIPQRGRPHNASRREVSREFARIVRTMPIRFLQDGLCVLQSLCSCHDCWVRAQIASRRRRQSVQALPQFFRSGSLQGGGLGAGGPPGDGPSNRGDDLLFRVVSFRFTAAQVGVEVDRLGESLGEAVRGLDEGRVLVLKPLGCLMRRVSLLGRCDQALERCDPGVRGLHL